MFCLYFTVNAAVRDGSLILTFVKNPRPFQSHNICVNPDSVSPGPMPPEMKMASMDLWKRSEPQASDSGAENEPYLNSDHISDPNTYHV